MLADKLRLCYRAIISSPTTGTQNAIFAFGWTGSYLSVSNIFGSSGIMAADASNAGTTGRSQASAATYGGDKVIIGWGAITASPYRWSSITKVSNTGTIGSDENTSGIVGRTAGAAAAYGNDKAIFGFGAQQSGTNRSTNLVSNTGVMAADYVTTNARRYSLVAAGYGGDKAIFALGRLDSGALTKFSALVSNTGVLGSDTSNVGVSDGDSVAAATFGGDKAIISFGDYRANKINIISNTGVIQADTAYVGTSRSVMSGSSYGTDKAVFGFGITSVYTSIINKVSNTGIIESDTSTVGMARVGVSAAGFGSSSGGGGTGVAAGYFVAGTGSGSTSPVSSVSFASYTSRNNFTTLAYDHTVGVGFNSSAYGFALWAISGLGVGVADAITFSTDTTRTVSTGYAEGRGRAAGCHSSFKGYAVGGEWSSTASTKLTSFTFVSETTDLSSLSISGGSRLGTACNSSNSGIVFKGGGSTSVVSFNFAENTLSPLGASVSTGWQAGYNSSDSGYASGGFVSGSASRSTTKVVFSSSAISTLSLHLTAAVDSTSAASGTLEGLIFYVGGNTTINSNSYATDACTAISASLHTKYDIPIGFEG